MRKEVVQVLPAEPRRGRWSALKPYHARWLRVQAVGGAPDAVSEILLLRGEAVIRLELPSRQHLSRI